MGTKTIVPARTREGEFAAGGTGGFDALESYYRQRTPEDERREQKMRGALVLGYRHNDWRALNALVEEFKKRGLKQKDIDRMIRSMSRGLQP